MPQERFSEASTRPASQPPVSPADVEGARGRLEAVKKKVLDIIARMRGAPAATEPEPEVEPELDPESEPEEGPEVPAELPEEMPMAAAAPRDPEAMLTDVPAELLEPATGRMVEMGLIERATGIMTAEVMAILSATVEANFPGLIDLSNPDDMRELLKGVANGTIEPVAPSGKLSGGVGAQPGPGPQP